MLISVGAAASYLAMFIKNWLAAGEFSALVFAPVAHVVVLGNDLLIGRGLGALLLSVDFAVMVLCWTALWQLTSTAIRALDKLDPGQP